MQGSRKLLGSLSIGNWSLPRANQFAAIRYDSHTNTANTEQLVSFNVTNWNDNKDPFTDYGNVHVTT